MTVQASAWWPVSPQGPMANRRVIRPVLDPFNSDLRRGKHKRAARQALQDAAAVFGDLGARLWAAKIGAELARIGGRAPATGGLTPTERRVAELVAEGHSNREVADLLFLSAKTVAAHLTSAYAKLRASRRTGRRSGRGV